MYAKDGCPDPACGFGSPPTHACFSTWPLPGPSEFHPPHPSLRVAKWPAFDQHPILPQINKDSRIFTSELRIFLKVFCHSTHRIGPPDKHTNLAGQCNSPVMRKGGSFLCFFNLALHSVQSRKSRKCERNVEEIIKGL